MLLIKMALRNIFRQKRRTIFTALTMVVGFVLAAFSIGWADGTYNNIIDIFTKSWLGHIQIHYKDYLDKPSIYKTIDNYNEISDKLLNIKGINSYTFRIYSAGLVSLGEKTSGVRIIGFDEKKEDKTTLFHKKIVKGNYFSNKQKNELLIGKGLAKILHAKIGDKVVLVSQASDGSIANDFFKIVGFVSTDDEISDRSFLYMKLKNVQEFLVLDNKIHEIAIRINSIKNVKKIKNKIASIIKDNSINVETWQEFAKDFYKAMKADKGGMWVSLFVIVLVVAVGVLNTVLMSVLERFREYGLLKALGTKPKDIILLVLYETNIIAIISIVIGGLIAFGINYYFSLHGIQLPQAYSYGGMSFSEMMTEINLRSFLIPALTILFTGTLVGFFPALKASKIEPVKSLRFH